MIRTTPASTGSTLDRATPGLAVGLAGLLLFVACGGSASAPSAPLEVTATAGNGKATVSWAAPADEGSSAISGYTLISSPENLSATVPGSVRSATVSGLTNGTAYTFVVLATNDSGNGPASVPSAAIVPAAPPGAPTGLVATRDGSGSIALSWSAPDSTGGLAIDSYVVVASPGGASVSVPGNSLMATIDGLTNGTEYTFTVTAKSAAGTGAASAPSAPLAPGTAPAAPTMVTATVNGGEVDVSWVEPDDGGFAVTSYSVLAEPGDVALSTTSTTASFSSLSPGTSYTFTVTAENALGVSPSSEPSNAVTPQFGACNPANTTLGSNGGPDTCHYGEYCGSDDVCHPAPVGSCAQASAAGASNWTGTDTTAPVVTSVTAVGSPTSNSSTECGSGGPKSVFTVDYYVQGGLTMSTSFIGWQSNTWFTTDESIPFNHADFSGGEAPSTISDFGELKFGICGTQSGTAAIYLSNDSGKTSNIVCVAW